MPYYVYILASRRNGTLYTGVTNDLVRRVHQHKHDSVPGFTSKHGVKTLVYFETYQEPRPAIQREKNIKHWSRAWKIALVEKDNRLWKDLYATITQ